MKRMLRLFESKSNHSGNGNLVTAYDQGNVERYPLQVLCAEQKETAWQHGMFKLHGGTHQM